MMMMMWETMSFGMEALMTPFERMRMRIQMIMIERRRNGKVSQW